MRRVIDRGPFGGLIGRFNLVVSFHIFPYIVPYFSSSTIQDPILDKMPQRTSS